MSAALVNRSLTTIRTELEFLKDSDVITEGLYEKLLQSLPTKYQKDSAPWDVDRIAGGSSGPGKVQNKSAADVLADDFSKPTFLLHLQHTHQHSLHVVLHQNQLAIVLPLMITRHNRLAI